MMGVATPRSSRRRFLRRQPQTSSESVGSRQDFLTAAAAAAALHCGIKYEGVCTNTADKQWLDGLLDKAIYAVAVDSPESAAAVGASTQINSTQLKRFCSGSG